MVQNIKGLKFDSFNRTFMELKLDLQANAYGRLIVLIVPLWNWNSGCNSATLLRVGFNRTFMELKYGRGRRYLQRLEF